MRVQCSTVDDFITNLRAELPSAIVSKVVYVSQVERSLDSGDPRQATRFTVYVQASCVVDLEDGGQYLLEMAVNCGLDYRDATNEREGTSEAARVRQKLTECCDDLGLRIRPGVLDV